MKTENMMTGHLLVQAASADSNTVQQIKKELNRIERNRRQRETRRARHEVYTSLGLKRVKGALGGTYYE